MRKKLERLENRFVYSNLDILKYEEYLEAQQALIQKSAFKRSVIAFSLFCAGLLALHINIMFAVFLLALAANFRISTHFFILTNEIINQHQLLGRLINGKTENLQIPQDVSKNSDEDQPI